ncbi:MAG: glycosyltransferase family 4 protein [Dinoroseobacter sp.]|nr:glycosyltransferase family 4 protein [Dinoroseobacter sp.]
MKGRRILIIVENLPVPFDRRVWLEAQTLNAAGAEVSIICPATKEHPERRETLDGIHIYRHPLNDEGTGKISYIKEYATALFWQTVLAWRIFLTQGFDTVHGCNPPDLVFLIAAQFRLFGPKYIFDHHDIVPEFYVAKFGKRGFFWRMLKISERLNFWMASTVISTNESYKAIAIQRGGKRAEDVFVVRSGPDLSRMRRVPANPDWKRGKRFHIGYVGVMAEGEGIDLLLESAQHLIHDRGPDEVQFTLVGGGPALAHFKALCSEMGLDDNVEFTGRAPDADLLEVLSTADICVNPDRVNEMNDKSTMNKILEYMAMKQPIVQYDVTEGRHSAEDASLYAKPNDAEDFAAKIAQLLDAPEQRETMGGYGHQRLTRDLHWGHSIEPLIAAYKHVRPALGVRLSKVYNS